MTPEHGHERANGIRSPWKVLAGVGTVGVQCSVGYFHPLIGTVLAFADLGTLLVIFAVVLFGSDHACDRVFRLLRWAANRPEPPAPPSLRDGIIVALGAAPPSPTVITGGLKERGWAPTPPWAPTADESPTADGP
jgi:hypothetical protein